MRQNMKPVNLFEFKDLLQPVQDAVRARVTNEYAEDGVQMAIDDDTLTDDDRDYVLGCDEQYRETTPWFVPDAYYEKNKEDVDIEVDKNLKEMLFTKSGKFVMHIPDDKSKVCPACGSESVTFEDYDYDDDEQQLIAKPNDKSIGFKGKCSKCGKDIMQWKDVVFNRNEAYDQCE